LVAILADDPLHLLGELEVLCRLGDEAPYLVVLLLRVGDLARRYALFSVPILAAFGFMAALNAASAASSICWPRDSVAARLTIEMTPASCAPPITAAFALAAAGVSWPATVRSAVVLAVVFLVAAQVVQTP